MYPIRRLLLAVADAKLDGSLDPLETAALEFKCMPWDLDMFAEMNNGRALTLYDLGRINFAIRSGLTAVLKKNNWGLVVAGSTIRYRNRVRAFDKVTLYTRLAEADERWVYVEQSMWVGDKPCSHVLLRTAATEKGKILPTERVMQALGVTEMDFSHVSNQAWTKTWVDCDDKRPWPPFGTANIERARRYALPALDRSLLSKVSKSALAKLPQKS